MSSARRVESPGARREGPGAKRHKPGLLVLISEDDWNLQAILDACASGELEARVVAVISDKPEAYGLERARLARVPAVAKVKPRSQERREYDAELAELVHSYHPDWVILSGWQRTPTSAFLAQFSRRVLSLHPALPGAFPGTHAIERAYYAYCRGEIEQTGVTAHLVVTEEEENGPVLGQETVSIVPEDTVETLEARIRSVAPRLLVTVLARLTHLTPEYPNIEQRG